jgi:hypothetical protein
MLSISDGTQSNRISIGITATERPRLLVTVGGAGQADIQPTAPMSGVTKMAGAYKVDDFRVYINGSDVGNDTSGTVPTSMSEVTLGHEVGGTLQLNGWIRSVALFPTRLANATLASLTA